MTRISGLVLFVLIALFPGTALFSQERTLVHIEFWEQDGADQQIVLDQLINQFQKKNKDIILKRVHYQTEDLRKNFVSAAIGGWGPDVVLGPNDNLGVFVPGDLIEPIESVMGKSFIEEFDPVAVNASKYNNQVYLIPDRHGNELCLIYNKAMVTKAPETWEEMVSIGTGLKSAGKTKYTLAFCMPEPFFTIPFLKAFGGEVFDNPASQEAQPTLNTSAMKKLCRFLRNIQQDGIIPTFSDYDAASNLFTEKKVPFLINGPWSFRDYIENHGMNIGIAPIPKVNGVWPAPYSAVKGYTISSTAVKDERKKEAVKKFVRFMTAKDAQLQMAESHRQLPAIKSAIKDKRIAGKEMMRQQQLQLEKAIAMPVITQMRAVWDAMKLVQINIFAGRTEPENAPAQMQRRAVDGMRALGMRINPATDYPDVSIDPYTEPSHSDTQ